MFFFVDDSSDHNKQRVWIKNDFVAISHNKYKYVLLNKKCLRHSMNEVQGKDHKIETYEINKVSLPWFDDTIYILNNGFDGSAIGY